MEKVKTPLTILTCGYAIGFFDGMFGWGLDEGIYMLAGFAILGALGYIWYIVTR
jgi:hypothetical protein